MPEILQEAARRGLTPWQHPVTGQTIINGLRADIWMRLKDKPNRRFVGGRLIKEYDNA